MYKVFKTWFKILNLYADDWSLNARPVKESIQIKELNHDCENFKEWLSKWRQPFNETKTVYIRFSNYRRYKNFYGNWKNLGTKSQIYFMVNLLKDLRVTKYLGYYFNTTWNSMNNFQKWKKLWKMLTTSLSVTLKEKNG